MGVYAPMSVEAVNELHSLALNQQKNPISWFVSDEENELYFELQGFCIEAKPSDMPAELPESVLVFDNAKNYLEWITKDFQY